MRRLLVYFDCGHALVSQDKEPAFAVKTKPGLSPGELLQLIKSAQINCQSYIANPSGFCKLCNPKNNPLAALQTIIQHTLAAEGLPALTPEQLTQEIKAGLKLQGYTEQQITALFA